MTVWWCKRSRMYSLTSWALWRKTTSSCRRTVCWQELHTRSNHCGWNDLLTSLVTLSNSRCGNTTMFSPKAACWTCRQHWSWKRRVRYSGHLTWGSHTLKMAPWISYLWLFFHDHWVRILLNNVKLSRICRHFGFAMATGGRKPVACSKMLIFSHLVNFGRNFPSSLLHWQNGLGTAWPGWEPEVKRPE